MKEEKVCVVGLGGVGGYIGCMFAKHFDNVYFLARGKRLESIRENGLKLYSAAHGKMTVHPKMASDNAEEIGVMDYIFICVKQFSLEQVCAQISPMIDEHTIIIPLINGVGVSDKIRGLIDKGCVIDSLIYIVSGADEEFAIHHDSSYCNIHIGYGMNSEFDNSILSEVQKMLQSVGITCIIENDIQAAIWKKYILNCGYNIITAYYNATTSDIRKNEVAVKQLKLLYEEACSVARKLNVNIDDNLEEVHLNHMLYKQSDSSTSSLKRDIEAGRKNELDVFSGKLIELALSCNVKVPMTTFFYNELKKKS
ncbi:ketopantoate reductase family protein [Clostridium saccharobutylicum]|uniref:2-dehydropantoate 2-reductase n=1 Tax=Clostridium saccharobutylicum TaxID=169679 RepID=A0A1S8N1R0_CLOSA|nr:2-dehydropantoate 2-reductase [Clostridium saccharobutylicum]OOM10394.1 2-dehydropantoate 2-reductase [Clostridium saccharobutylicum]